MSILHHLVNTKTKWLSCHINLNYFTLYCKSGHIFQSKYLYVNQCLVHIIPYNIPNMNIRIDVYGDYTVFSAVPSQVGDAPPHL